MTNDAVVFSRGLAATMPATYQEGRFLLQTDTGALFLDDTASSRIQIKDTTKLPLSGGTMTGPINMNSQKIINLANPTDNNDATNKIFVDTAFQTLEAEVNQQLLAYLQLKGGTMTGILDMGDYRITSLAAPSAGTDAATKQYVDNVVSGLTPTESYLPLSGGTMTGTLDMGSNRITSLSNPSNTADAATKGYVDTQVSSITPGISQSTADGRYLQLTGGTLSGNLTISGGYNVNLNGEGQVMGLADPVDTRDAVPYYMFENLSNNAVRQITPWTVSNLVTVAADGSLIAEVPQSTFLTQTTADNRYARSSSEWTTGYLVGINAAGQLFGSIPVVRTLTISNTDAISTVTVTISTSYTGLSSSSISIPKNSSVTIPIISSNGNFVMIFRGTAQLDSDQEPYGVSRSGSTYTITDMVGTVFLNHPCLTGDTLITMADGSIKRLDEIVLGEEVLHFDFSTKSLVPCKVIRLDNEDYRVSDQYDKFVFSDGTEIKAVNSHYFYNYDHKHMVDIFKWDIGDRAYSQNGELISLVSRETVSEQIRYYNIVVDSGPVYGTNYFANGLMSGDCANGDSNNIHTYFEELDVF